MNEQASHSIPAGDGDIGLRWPGVAMSIGFVAPDLVAGPGHAWRHRDRDEQAHRLAGRPGKTVRDTFAAGDLELVREVWIDDEGDAISIRHVLFNGGGETLALRELRPVHCNGPAALVIDGAPAGRWELLRQARLKNAIPSAVRLGVFDEDYEHATVTVGESGDFPTGADGQSVRLEIDPFAVIRVDDPAAPTHLLIGFLSQTDHLAKIELQTDDRRRELASLAARCEFDGCALPAGASRNSQWVMIVRGGHAVALIDDFAERVAAFHGVAEPPAPPAVWCSWYYYGPFFYEPQLHAELAYLEKNRLPFDVILIDDSRPRPWGDWLTHPRWPSGMKDAAERIAALGYRPGIWTCPYLAKTDSELAKDHPDWLLKRASGEHVTFKMDGLSYVLDPTHPEVDRFLEDLFRVMTAEWGFTYHKLDFMRAVFMDPQAQFADPSATRLEAYRRGLEAIRRGAGDDAYISVCGGHYGGSLGLADSQRSGSDVVASWGDPPALPAVKQNLLRTWMNRLWHTDADSMMVRRRDEPLNDSPWGRLSLGRFTDPEARTITANQYVGGGILCATESFGDIEPDRLALYRHVVPALRSPGVPLDPFNRRCPSRMLNRIRPRCRSLGDWATVTVFNWADDAGDERFMLCDEAIAGLDADRYLVFEFWSQEPIGLVTPGEAITLPRVSPHDCRVLRIAPWPGDRPVLMGTDLHLSGGAVEVAAWEVTPTTVRGVIETRWPHPVSVTIAFPSADGFVLRRVVVSPDERTFEASYSPEVLAAADRGAAGTIEDHR